MPFGKVRINQQATSFNEKNQFIGQEYDEDTQLSYLNARYYNGARGQFISQDPVFWEIGQSKEGMSALSDPQSMNSYSYAGNNPIKNSDPDGRWYKEVLTGQQSWSSFSGEVGQATQYMGSGWQTAMDHPVAAGAAVGVGSGLAAYGAAAGLTALSTQYLGGAGTACVALCNQNGQKLVEQGISNLQQLPRVVTATEKMVERGPNKDIVGINNFLQQAQKGTAYLDNKTGNINIFSKIGDSARYTRTTLNPEGNKIISAGINQARNVINGISNGRFTKITK